jgi:zinc protease
MRVISHSAFVCVVACCLLFAAQPTPAQTGLRESSAKPTAPPAPEKITTVEGITEYRLPNGIKVLLLPDQSKATATVDVTYLAGARHERHGEVGTAKLTQRLLFKGTSNNPAIDKELARRGIRFNGKAWLEHTHFSAVLQPGEENLQWVLQMEADRMVNARFAQKDLDAEIAAILKEHEDYEKKDEREMDKYIAEKKIDAKTAAGMKEGAQKRKKEWPPLKEKFDDVEYAWNNYGTTLNEEKVGILKTPLASLRAFYRTYYQPDNVVVMVAGKFDESKVLAWTAKFFGEIPKPTRELPKPETRLDFKVDDGNRDDNNITVSYKMPAAIQPDADALRFSAFVLYQLRAMSAKNKGPSSGLSQKSSRESGLKLFGLGGVATLKSNEETQADLKAINNQFNDRLQSSKEEKDRAINQYFADEKSRATRERRADLMKAVEDLGVNPLTAEEMARARQEFLSESARFLDNHEKLGAELADYIALGDWRLFFYWRDRAANMTAEEVTAASARHYRRENRVASVARVRDSDGRAGAIPVPTAADVLKNFKARETVTAAVGGTQSDNPDIDKRVKKMQIGGLTVSLLAKQTVGQSVAFNIRLRSGDEKALFGKAAVAEMAGRTLDRGTSKFQYGLFDESSRLRMRGNVSAGSANYQTTRPYVASAIKLAVHILREPTFSDFAAKTISDQMLGEVRAHKNSPSRVAMNALQRHFNIFPVGDFRNVRSFEEQEDAIKVIKASDLREFHKQFYGAAKGEVAVIGDFDEAEVTAALRESFADWSTDAPYKRLAMPYKEVTTVSRAVEMPGSESAFFAARLNVNMQDTDPDHAALVVANYIFGSAAGFASRLTARLRLQDGLSHAVRSDLNVNSTDRGSAWSVYAFADAQDVAKIEKAFKDELGLAIKNGFTGKEIAAAKSAVLQQRREQRMRDNVLAGGGISTGALAGQLVNNSDLGRTFAWSNDFESKISALKTTEVNAAFRKHIDPNKISIIKAGDFVNTAKMSSTVLPLIPLVSKQANDRHLAINSIIHER